MKKYLKKILCGVTAVAVAAGMLTTTLYIERQQNVYADEAVINSSDTVTDTKINCDTIINYTYVVNDDGNTVTLRNMNFSPLDSSEENTSREVIFSIPSSVTDDEGVDYTVTAIYSGSDQYPVYSFAPSFFNSCSIFVTIPNTVTSIGENAFSYCTALNSVTFEQNSKLTSIGDGAFQSCVKRDDDNNKPIGGLTSIIIPNSVTSIGDSAFSYCVVLDSVTFEQNSKLTSIGKYAFEGCVDWDNSDPVSNTPIVGLGSIEIPNSVTSIGDSAFESCSLLTSVTFEQNSKLTSIGNSAFDGCGLESVDIPDGVKLIGKSAFACYEYIGYECNGTLKSVTIPESVIFIGDGAFSGYFPLNDNFSISYSGSENQFKQIISISEPEGISTFSKYYESIKDTPSLLPTTYGKTDNDAENFTPLDAPELSLSSAEDGKVKVSWPSDVNAKGYLVLFFSNYSNDLLYPLALYDPIIFTIQNLKNDEGNVEITLSTLYKNTQYGFIIIAIDKNGILGQSSATPYSFNADTDSIGGESWIDRNTSGEGGNPDFNYSSGPSTEAAYNVEHYKQNATARTEDGYTLEETENRRGEIGETATATRKSYPGMHVNEDISILSGTIAADGSLVLKVFYDYDSNNDDSSSTSSEESSSNSSSTPTSTPPSEPESSKPGSSTPSSSKPGSSTPESSNSETYEPESSNPNSSAPNKPNPSTGIPAFILPIVLASGAVFVAASKKKRS